MIGEMTHLVKILATKPDDMSLIPGTHDKEISTVFWPPFALYSMHVCVCVHLIKNVNSIKKDYFMSYSTIQTNNHTSML